MEGVGPQWQETAPPSTMDLRLMICKHLIYQILVRNIALYERKVRKVIQIIKTLFLQTHIVIIIHIVDSHNLRGIEILVYRLYKIAADESGSSSHQYCHIN